MEVMDGHDVRQDDRADEMTTATMVAAVDRSARDMGKVRAQEFVLDVVHLFHCACCPGDLAKRSMNYKGAGAGKRERE